MPLTLTDCKISRLFSININYSMRNPSFRSAVLRRWGTGKFIWEDVPCSRFLGAFGPPE